MQTRGFSSSRIKSCGFATNKISPQYHNISRLIKRNAHENDTISTGEERSVAHAHVGRDLRQYS